MRFHLRRFAGAVRRAGDWLSLFGRRLRAALTSRFVLVPFFCVISIWLYSRYITQWNLFIIFDQGKVTIHETYTRDAETALAEAGIYIRGNDIVSLPRGQLSGGAAEIRIVRTNEVTVVLEGVAMPVVCPNGKVADALAKAGYVADPRSNVRDQIDPSPETPIEDGMTITVTRYTVLYETETEAIPYGTVEQDSPYLNQGASVVTVEGEEGQRELVYEVILRDGVEYHRGEAQMRVVREPVDEVVVFGIGGTIRLADGTRVSYSKRLDVECTAYTTERQANKFNAIGNIARVGTLAVDPKYISLRIDVVVTSRNGTWNYGKARTEDTGKAIKGYIIDLYFDTWEECRQFGRRLGYLYILN